MYIAVISPIGGYHDRACELYQQLVGITALRKKNRLKNNDNGLNLVKAVYGEKHTCEEHYGQIYYKPKLLRQLRGTGSS